MKSILSLLFVAASTMVLSQKIDIKEVSESFKNGQHNALEMIVPQAGLEQVEKALKSEMKDWGGKYSSSKKEMAVSQGSTPSMGTKPFDAYAKVSLTKEGTVRVVIAFDLGGAYLNSSDHMSLYNAMATKLEILGVSTAKEAVSDKLKEASKEEQKLSNEQENLVKEKKDLENSIEEAQKRIEEAKKALEANKKNQGDNQKALTKKSEEVKRLEKTLSGIQ